MEPRITLTLSSVGQITIPRSVRKALGLEKGAKLDLEVDEEAQKFTLKKQPSHEEVFAELKRLAEKRPKPDPKLRNMSVNEMYNLVEDNGDETWV